MLFFYARTERMIHFAYGYALYSRLRVSHVLNGRFLRNDAHSLADLFTVVGITPSWFLADSGKRGRAPAISSSQMSFSYVLFPETADSRKPTTEWDVILSRYATWTGTINGQSDFSRIIGCDILSLKLINGKIILQLFYSW